MLLPLLLLASLVRISGLRTLAIAGAAGRVGRQLIDELIGNNLRINGEEVKVKALVREISQLSDVKSKIDVVQVVISAHFLVCTFKNSLTHSLTDSFTHSLTGSLTDSLTKCNLDNDIEVLNSIRDVDAMIWVASGFSDRSSKVNQLLSGFKLKFFPSSCTQSSFSLPTHSLTHSLTFLLGIDIKTVSLIGSTLAASNTAQGIVKNGPKFVLCSSAGVTRPFWSEKKKLALG